MPPRTAAKPRATRAKAPASPEPAVVEEVPEPDDVEEDDEGPISLTTSAKKDGAVKPDLVEIFNVDGRPFFLDAARPAQVVLNGMWLARERKLELVGAMEFIKTVLGDDALTALRRHPDFDPRILFRVVNKIMDTANGGLEPGKS